MPIVQQLSMDFATLVVDDKRCCACKEWKPFSEFHSNRSMPDGKQIYCKPCMNAANQRSVDKPEHRAAKRARERERSTQLRRDNPEKVQQKQAAWYAKNGDDYHRKWRAENREKLRQQKKARYDADPEKYIAESLHRSAMRRGSPTGNHTVAEWKALCARYDNRCLICFSKKRLTRDHIVPLTQGGTDSIENISVLCNACNARKNNRFYCSRPDRLLPAYTP